jgi:ABC-type amino acid transport system permease subunit
VTRFFAWPAPDYGYLVSPSQTVLLITVAVIIALVVAKLAWSYRRQTQRLLLLAHLSAVLIGMDLLAWWLAALDPDKLIPAPSFWYWAALVIGWLATAFACWLHDLRAGRHSPE